MTTTNLLLIAIALLAAAAHQLWVNHFEVPPRRSSIPAPRPSSAHP